MAKDKDEKGLAVDLTLSERITLGQLLPEKGPIATVKLVRILAERLSLTADEIESYGVETFGDRLQWKETKKTRKFTFSGFELELIIGQLRKANDAQTLTPGHVSLWDKFIPDVV